MGWIALLLAIPGVILGVFSVTVPVLIPVTVLYFLTLVAAITAVGGIFDVALYQYATTGQAPSGYSQELLNGVFINRKQP
jgi:hypothetical protein